jgi:phenylpropionate dioxygenase-like ring-hydroxylating dioxygenase large terminal subunit
MIPNQWYAILESREVKRGQAVGVTRLGEKMVVWRDQRGVASCLSDLCAHRGVALSIGKVRGDCIECPFHGFQYDASGRCQYIPANGRISPVPKAFAVRSYPVREAHGFVWIWWGEPREELPPLPFFEDIDAGFAYSSFRDHWPVHYSRAIENQLDVFHLPFVHGSTIGRGGRTLADGPVVAMVDDRMDIWVYNRVDDGTRPLRPAEIPPPRRPPFLQFRFPNIWQNRIANGVRIFLSFTPVDEENTLIYMRYYQRIGRLGPLARAATTAGILSSIVILRQDKRVVVTQRPVKTDIAMGEKLVQADRPIVVYRSVRRKLIDAASGGAAENPGKVESSSELA